MARCEGRWRQMEDNMRNKKESLVEILCVTDLIHNPASFYHVIHVKDMEEIEALSSSNQRDKAARMFLDSFLSSEDETKWSVLDQALCSRPELNLVREILVNEETPSLDTQKHEQRQVKLQRCRIAENIPAYVFAEYLLQEEFLTDEQYQQVQATLQSKGDIAANILQLELACRRENFIHKLLDFLCRYKKFDLAKIIDPKLTKKICDSSDYEDPENDNELSNDMYPSGTMAANIDYSSDPESSDLKAVPSPEKSAPVADLNNLNYDDGPVASRTRSKTKLLHDKAINVETVPGQDSRNDTRNISNPSAHSLDRAIPAMLEQRHNCYHSPDNSGQQSASTPKEKPMAPEKCMTEMPIDCQGRTVTITNVFCLGPQFGDQAMTVQKLTPGRADVIQDRDDESDETGDERLKDNSNARHTNINDAGRRERQHEAKPAALPTHCKPKKNTDVRPKVKTDRRPLPETRVETDETSHIRLKEKSSGLKTTVTPHELFQKTDIGNHFNPSISTHRKAAASENRETPQVYKAGWKPTTPADASSNIDPSITDRQKSYSHLSPDLINRLERCHDCGQTFQSKNVLDKHKKDACLINRVPTGLEQLKPTSAGSLSVQTLPAVSRDLSHHAILKSASRALESSPELNLAAGGPKNQLLHSRDPIEVCFRCDSCGTTWKSINALKNHQEGECLKDKMKTDALKDVTRSPDSDRRTVCENVMNKQTQSHTKKVTLGLGFRSVETSRRISEGTAGKKQEETKLLRQSYARSNQDTDPRSTKHSDPRPSTQTLLKATELSDVKAKEQISKQKTPPPQVSSGNTVQNSKDGRLIDTREAAKSRLDSRRQQIEDNKSTFGSPQAPSRSQSLTKGPAHEYQTAKSIPREKQVSNPKLIPNVVIKMKRCLDCGQTFQSQDFLDKHQKGACPENRNEPSQQQSKAKSTGSLTSQKTSTVKRELASDVKLIKSAPQTGCSCGRTVCEHVSTQHAQKHATKVKTGFGFQSPQTLKYNIAEDSD